MSVYGQPPYRVVDDQSDRIGIRTLILSKLWQASRPDLSVDELDGEAPTRPLAPKALGLIGHQRRPQSGGLRDFWTFSGASTTVPLKGYGKSMDYQFDPGFSQVSILKLPGIQRLMDQYGGQVLDAEIVWPPLIESGASRGGSGLGLSGGDTGGGTVNSLGLGASGAGSTASKTNPMFGETDFFRTEGTYSYRYAATNLNGLVAGVRIVQAGNLPGRAPSYAGRDYLVGPQPYRTHGSDEFPVFAITLVAWLSGEGGWNQLIYGGGKVS